MLRRASPDSRTIVRQPARAQTMATSAPMVPPPTIRTVLRAGRASRCSGISIKPDVGVVRDPGPFVHLGLDAARTVGGIEVAGNGALREEPFLRIGGGPEFFKCRRQICDHGL